MCSNFINNRIVAYNNIADNFRILVCIDTFIYRRDVSCEINVYLAAKVRIVKATVDCEKAVFLNAVAELYCVVNNCLFVVSCCRNRNLTGYFLTISRKLKRITIIITIMGLTELSPVVVPV